MLRYGLQKKGGHQLLWVMRHVAQVQALRANTSATVMDKATIPNVITGEKAAVPQAANPTTVRSLSLPKNVGGDMHLENWLLEPC